METPVKSQPDKLTLLLNDMFRIVRPTTQHQRIIHADVEIATIEPTFVINNNHNLDKTK